MLRPGQYVARGVTLAAVAVLIGLAAWQWHGEHRDATLLAVSPEAIDHIRVQKSGQAPQHYVKRDGHWYTADGNAADADRLGQLTELADVPVLNWRDTSDPDATGASLAQPQISITLNGQRTDWGQLAAFGPQRFVRVGDRIAVVPASYSPSVGAEEAGASTVAAPASSSQKS